MAAERRDNCEALAIALANMEAFKAEYPELVKTKLELDEKEYERIRDERPDRFSAYEKKILRELEQRDCVHHCG